jgi:hypothetical protein
MKTIIRFLSSKNNRKTRNKRNRKTKKNIWYGGAITKSHHFGTIEGIKELDNYIDYSVSNERVIPFRNENFIRLFFQKFFDYDFVERNDLAVYAHYLNKLFRIIYSYIIINRVTSRNLDSGVRKHYKIMYATFRDTLIHKIFTVKDAYSKKIKKAMTLLNNTFLKINNKIDFQGIRDYDDMSSASTVSLDDSYAEKSEKLDKWFHSNSKEIPKKLFLKNPQRI